MSLTRKISPLTLAALMLLPMDILASTVTADADAFIYSRAPTSNFGNRTTLQVKNAASNTGGNTFNRKVYTRFDLSSFMNTPFLDATLSFTLSGANLGDPSSVSGTLQEFSVYGLNDGLTGENWLENNITWNNAPQNITSSGNGVGANTTFISNFAFTGTGTAGNVIQISNNALTAFLNNDTNNLATFILVRNTFDTNPGGWVHSFASKENLNFNGPLLDITESPINRVPVPTSLILMVSALGALGWKKRSATINQ